MNHPRSRLLAILCGIAFALNLQAAGPPWPQPLHNVRAVRVAGLQTQTDADRIMKALRQLPSVWLVTDLTPESGFVRIGFDVRAVNEHAIAQTIMDQGDYTVSTHFTISEYSKYAAEIDQIMDRVGSLYPIKISLKNAEQGEFQLTYLPIQMDPENPRKVGFAGGFLHHPLSVDKPPKGLGLKFTDISAPKSERNLIPKTHMTFRGKLLLVEDFAEPIQFAERLNRNPETWSEGWRVKNGTWTLVDGGVRGVVRPAVYPAATLHRPIAYQDVVIQVDVRLDDIPLAEPPQNNYLSASVVLREADASHIASARVTRSGFSAYKDKTKSREVNHQRTGDEEIPFGKHPLAMEAGNWYTVLVEVKGEEMLATLDGKHPIHGRHPILGLAKGLLSFGTPRSATFRNLRVFEALPNPQWEANKAVLFAPATAHGLPVPNPSGVRTMVLERHALLGSQGHTWLTNFAAGHSSTDRPWYR